MSNLIAQFGEGLTPPTGDAGLVGTINEISTDISSGNDMASLTGIEKMISTMIGFLTVVATLLFLGFFVLGAINWITAGGDSGKIATARQKMINSTIGLVVVVAAYMLITVIGKFVGIDILNPATTLQNAFGL